MSLKIMQNNWLKSILFFVLASVSLSSCGQGEKKTNPVDSLKKSWSQTIPGNFSDQSKAIFDSTELVSFIKNYPDFKPYTADIGDFYKRRKYSYAWFNDGVLIEQAGNLFSRVSNLQDEGVYKSAPYQKVLDSLVYNSKKEGTDVQLELMLTAQYFVFSKLAWNGMSSTVSKSLNWYLPRKKVAYNEYLDSILKIKGKAAPATEPVYRQYELLRNYLSKYRKLDSLDNWLPFTIKKGSVKPGDTSSVIPLVKARLYKLGDYHADTVNNNFDTLLATALKHFQARHGLINNGLLNTATVAELNVPLKSRIKQLLVNMERCRWLPLSLNSDYLVVNIPEFKLHVYHADSLLWSCNVVVGQTVHQTTVFYGEIQYIVFSPYWNVPPSIVQKEVLPAMRKRANYLAKEHMEITGYRDGLPVVRQKPGPENSLGLVKFLFPNSYNIYLHDTPSKSLFSESSRGFSHGCIRIQEPFKLATFLLKDYPAWSTAKIDQAMDSGKEQTVTLTKKVPVFIAYFTAFIDRDNTLNFRNDIYNHDEKLASMILSGKGDY
ncbi:L,D-transpeptidase family protein [Mucilaginibacter xinganensis]|nr:L,D-transpeptidase family protein [Mucilaginibacter xinganensis]